jgi:hypothetical protein
VVKVSRCFHCHLFHLSVLVMGGCKVLWNDGILSPDHAVSYPWFSYFAEITWNLTFLLVCYPSSFYRLALFVYL